MLVNNTTLYPISRRFPIIVWYLSSYFLLQRGASW